MKRVLCSEDMKVEVSQNKIDKLISDADKLEYYRGLGNEEKILDYVSSLLDGISAIKFDLQMNQGGKV